MKFGTRILEYFLIICIAVITILNFIVLTGSMLTGVDSASLLNMFMLIVIGSLLLIAIILLRIYEQIQVQNIVKFDRKDLRSRNI